MPAWKPGGQMNHGHELDGNSTRGLRCSLASHHEMRAVFRNSVSFLSQRQLTCACTFILSSPLRVCHQQSYETWTHCVHRSHPMTMKWDAVNEWIRISEQKISLPTGISQSIFVPCVSNVRVHRVILCLSSSIAQSICQRFRTVQIENATKFTTILNIQSTFLYCMKMRAPWVHFCFWIYLHASKSLTKYIMPLRWFSCILPNYNRMKFYGSVFWQRPTPTFEITITTFRGFL